jgi:hypothetical protein
MTEALRDTSCVKYSHAPVSTDSVSAVSVIRGLKKNWKIKEINRS